MTGLRLLCPLTRLAAAAALALALSAPAQAVLSNPLTVSLIAPGGDVSSPDPFTLSQIVDPATGIQAGDGTAIGGYMLPGELVQFDGNSILLHVAVGYDDGAGNLSTGVLGSGADHGRYQFDGLAIAGQVITGITVYHFDGYVRSGGTSSVLGGIGVSLATPQRLLFDLDALRFQSTHPVASQNFGEFRIDLLTQPVPEPASWALLLAGLVAVVKVNRSAAARFDRRRPVPPGLTPVARCHPV